MDGQAVKATNTLPEIPRIALGDAGPLALIEAEPKRFADIMTQGKAHYGATMLGVGDKLTERWLHRAQTPYVNDLTEVARRGGRPGSYMLNMSYEWSCTAAVGAPPSGNGNRLLRTLDWPLTGLGRNLVVAEHDDPAGPWYNITWPGFVGSATAMAPGRFAASLNQPPMRKRTNSCWLDWAVERTQVWRRTHMPAVHLLRFVFETCTSYQDAKQVLSETPIAMPAFFSLSGTRPEDGCVIERTETRAFVRSDQGRATAANHWVTGYEDGRLRGQDSPGRYALMDRLQDSQEDGFDWVRDPILNPTTRLALTANAKTGSLKLFGLEKDGPATRILEID